jgi:hypothetical protein
MRRKPYTEAGIRRMPCFRCGQPAEYQWQVCADNNVYRPICAECDIALNTLVLMFMRDPDRDQKMKEYVKRVAKQTQT